MKRHAGDVEKRLSGAAHIVSLEGNFALSAGSLRGRDDLAEDRAGGGRQKRQTSRPAATGWAWLPQQARQPPGFRFRPNPPAPAKCTCRGRPSVSRETRSSDRVSAIRAWE